MAETFENFKKIDVSDAGTYGEAVYTAPAGKKAIVISLQVSNKDTEEQTIDASFYDATDTTYAYYGFGLSISTGTSMNPLVDKVVLNAGDAIYIKASAAGVIDVVGSVIEIDV